MSEMMMVSKGLMERLSGLFPEGAGNDGSGRIGFLPHVTKTVDDLRALLSKTDDAEKVNNRQMGLVQFVEKHAAQAAPRQDALNDWAIDHSAGRPILVFKKCSVIEAEDAHYILDLIRLDREQETPRQEPVLFVAVESIEDLECVGMHATRKANDLQHVALYTSPPAPVSSDLACDRAYRNGLQRGFGLGESGHVEQYHKEFGAYQREILSANKDRPAPSGVVLPSPDDLRHLISRAARQADLIGGANYYTAAELAAEALIDKVKELNQ